MKKRTYYQAVEYVTLNGETRGLKLSKKDANKDWISRFKTYEEAKAIVDDAINSRKTQYFYWRDADGKIIDKISYYDRYPVSYKIFKVIEQEEELFACDNSDVELREPSGGREETTL